MVFQVVLTGGPCAGKTSVLQRLKQRLADQAVFVDEAATQLFAAGWPLPSPDWTDDEWLALQRAITTRQLALEDLAQTEAMASGRSLIVCDRAPYDNTAYPMGSVAVRERVARDPAFGLDRYALVIHLESLATAAPERFGGCGNETRYESLAEARALELRTRRAWQRHPRWVFMQGRLGVDELAKQALQIIKDACMNEIERTA